LQRLADGVLRTMHHAPCTTHHAPRTNLQTDKAMMGYLVVGAEAAVALIVVLAIYLATRKK
jgi:hypothetical protein